MEAKLQLMLLDTPTQWWYILRRVVHSQARGVRSGWIPTRQRLGTGRIYGRHVTETHKIDMSAAVMNAVYGALCVMKRPDLCCGDLIIYSPR